jgi:hypothetical protein
MNPFPTRGKAGIGKIGRFSGRGRAAGRNSKAQDEQFGFPVKVARHLRGRRRKSGA